MRYLRSSPPPFSPHRLSAFFDNADVFSDNNILWAMGVLTPRLYKVGDFHVLVPILDTVRCAPEAAESLLTFEAV